MEVLQMMKWKSAGLRWSVSLASLVAFAVASGAGARWT
jgi:hypothetical protein